MIRTSRKQFFSAILIALWIFITGASSYSESFQTTPSATLPVDPNVLSPTPTKAPMSAENLIKLVNQARMSHHLPALVVDPILMQTAQTTADIMAGSQMTGHIGDVKSRVMASGYGVGDIPWATENFVVLPLGAEGQIMRAWADETHQIPMVNPYYRHVGAGVAVSGDSVYYVLHAAYTSNKIYEPAKPDEMGVVPVKNLISQYIYAVQTVTPGPNGTVIHKVRNGQTLWSIAIAYNVHIEDIKKANNLPQSLEMVYEGQELVIPRPSGAAGTLEVPPTLTQMIVFTETPTPRVQASQMTGVGQKDEIPGTPTLDPDGRPAENETNDIIFYSIGGAVVLGLALIIIGAAAGRNKGRS